MITINSKFQNSNQPLFTYLVILLFLRIIAVNFIKYVFPSIPLYIVWSIEYIEFLILSVYLVRSWSNLKTIYIDRSIVYLLVICVILVHIPSTFEFWQIFLAFLFWGTSTLLLLNVDKNVEKDAGVKGNMIQMIFVGVLIGVFLVFLLKIAPFLFLGTRYRLETPLITSIINFVNVFVFQLGHSVIFEEVLFRGMLIGYLKDLGLANKKVIIIQLLFFMAAHVSEISNLYIFLIMIPVCGLIIGLLAIRYKSVTPGIFTHVIYNSLSVLFEIIH